ncbi:hypothetical protein E4U15_002299 [Claviceps sp. LM218 group G6]|nr:hypothetical protein E4U15_002299 [Claviceps sp. LM218 group G6]
MAHDTQSAGAADGAVPMVSTPGRNAEAVAPEAITARERVPKHLQASYDKLACLLEPPALEGVWKVCQSMIDAEETRVRNASAEPRGPPPSDNSITVEDLDRAVEKAVQKALGALPRE